MAETIAVALVIGALLVALTLLDAAWERLGRSEPSDPGKGPRRTR